MIGYGSLTPNIFFFLIFRRNIAFSALFLNCLVKEWYCKFAGQIDIEISAYCYWGNNKKYKKSLYHKMDISQKSTKPSFRKLFPIYPPFPLDKEKLQYKGSLPQKEKERPSSTKKTLAFLWEAKNSGSKRKRFISFFSKKRKEENVEWSGGPTFLPYSQTFRSFLPCLAF